MRCKTVKLELLGDQAAALVKNLLEEAEASKVLNSHNIALLYGAEEVDGIFCASMEYVQGNSVATMLARKEGFSIWDLQDIARQTCQGLDHAHAKGLVHYTLEPCEDYGVVGRHGKDFGIRNFHHECFCCTSFGQRSRSFALHVAGTVARRSAGCAFEHF